MPFDPHPNLAYALVAVAPAPPGSGTTLDVTAGHGVRFPDPGGLGYNVTIWPSGELPIPANAEIARVTAVTGDTLTLTRAQEDTVPRAVTVGDQIAVTITAKTLTDLEAVALSGVPVPLSTAAVLVGRGSDDGGGDAQEITLSNAFIMTGTALTVRSGVFNYTYNTATVEPPAAGQARLDATFPWTGVTKLWVRFVSADGQDLYWGIMVIAQGSTVLLQDKDEHARYVRFTTTGDPIDKGLYAELPVAWQANGLAINTGQPVFLQVAGGILSPSTAARVTALEQRLAAVEARLG